jgi:hypothetical protein
MKNEKKINFRLDKLQIECPDDVMVEIYKKKTPAERIKIASGMWESARKQISAVIRSLHPDWKDDQVNKEVIKRLKEKED